MHKVIHGNRDSLRTRLQGIGIQATPEQAESGRWFAIVERPLRLPELRWLRNGGCRIEADPEARS